MSSPLSMASPKLQASKKTLFADAPGDRERAEEWWKGFKWVCVGVMSKVLTLIFQLHSAFTADIRSHPARQRP